VGRARRLHWRGANNPTLMSITEMGEHWAKLPYDLYWKWSKRASSTNAVAGL
jgi:hypothetical protein